MSTFVLIHGLNGAPSQMAAFAAAAPAGMAVVTPRLLGHAGRPTDTGYSADDLLADVLAQLEEQGVTTAHVLGYSFGGYLGLMLAHRRPELVASLVTVATKVGYDESAVAFLRYLTSEQRMADLPAADVRLGEELHGPEDWRAVARNNRAMFDTIADARLRRRDLVAIRAPVLMIVGEDDPTVTVGEAMAAATVVPRSRLKCLPTPGHPIARLAVDQVNALAGAFLSEQLAREQLLAAA